jgi:hypothetical protein
LAILRTGDHGQDWLLRVISCLSVSLPGPTDFEGKDAGAAWKGPFASQRTGNRLQKDDRHGGIEGQPLAKSCRH